MNVVSQHSRDNEAIWQFAVHQQHQWLWNIHLYAIVLPSRSMKEGAYPLELSAVTTVPTPIGCPVTAGVQKHDLRFYLRQRLGESG